MSGITRAEALRLVDGFGIDKLSLDQVEVAESQANEVLIRIRAVSLNYREFHAEEYAEDVRIRLLLLLRPL